MSVDKIINIDSIQNEALKKVAEESNVVTADDRELKGSEISVFSEKANMALASNPEIGFTNDDVSALLGFEKSKPEVDESTVVVEEPKKEEVKKEDKKPAEGQLTTLTKDEEKRAKKAIVKSIEKYIKAGVKSFDDLMAKVQKDNSNSEYAPLMAEVRAISEMIASAKYSSKDDIDNLDKTLKDKIDARKKDKKWDSFQKDVYDLFKKEAKKDQVAKEFLKIKEIYKQVKSEVTADDIKKNDDKKYELYEKKVKEALQKEEVEVTKNGKTEKKKMWDVSYYKHEAFDAFKKLLEEEMYQERKGQVKSTTSTTDDGVKDEITEKVGVSKKDKYSKKADARQKKEGQYEVGANHNTYHTRLDDLASVTRTEMEKALGKDLLQKLSNNNYLKEHQTEKGSYNLQEVAKMIQYRAGIDFENSASKDYKMSETKFIIDELTLLFGNQGFTPDDVKKLCEFVGINPQGKDYSFKTAYKDTLPGMITGAITGAVMAPVVEQTTNVVIEDATAQQFESLLKQAGVNGEVIREGANARLKIYQKVDLKLLGLIGGIAIGTAVEIAMSMIFGKDRDETSCISVSDYDPQLTRYTNLDEFIEYVKVAHPEKADFLIFLAQQAKNDKGEFDPNLLFSWRNRAAGVGSRMGQKECVGFSIYHDEIKPEVKEPKKPEDKKPEEKKPEPKKCLLQGKPVDNTFTYKVQGGDHWADIVEAFYPTWRNCFTEMYGANGAIRALQRLIATDENGVLDVDKFNLMWRKTYKGKKGGRVPSNIKMPASLGDCKLVQNPEQVVTVKRKNTGTGVYGGQLGTLGINNRSYVLKNGCHEEVTATGRNKKEALDNYNSQHGTTYTEADIIED